ncbi:hypothetical protein [Amycolatopsis dongchuanensis]|uniref:Uncharacterized protein n=1 Tax=Amycolatopsis dongchuanensis TaxID=1070866 RepID=A0ABP8VGL8_9PSEU
MSAAAYGWVVDTEDGPVYGPDPLDPVLRERLAGGEGQAFQMGEGLPVRGGGRRQLVYDTGRYLGPAQHRYAPLLQHGFPWSGATWIRYADQGRWSRRGGPWLLPAGRCLLARYRTYRSAHLAPAAALAARGSGAAAAARGEPS